MSDGFMPEGAGSGGARSDRWMNTKNWPEEKGLKKLRWRFLSGLARGFTGWSGGKPLRAPAMNMFPPNTKWDEKDFRGEKSVDTPKEAWAAFGYCPDEADPEVKGLEIPQATIRKALSALVTDWGDPRQFDIIISQNADKKGYTVTPHPSGKCPPNPAVWAKWEAAVAAGADMSKLYAGEDPFPGAVGASAPDTSDVPF